MHPDSQSRATELAERWERMMRTPLWHAAGCRCAGGAGCLLVNLASTETDLLDSLVHHARINRDTQAAALVLERLQAARQGDDVAPFGDWIRQLPDSALPGASADRLLAHIERFVDSLKAPPAPHLKYTYLGDIS